MTTMMLTAIMCFVVMGMKYMFHKSHLLMAIMLLEGLMLTMVLSIPIDLSSMKHSISPAALIILAISVCEASLGLSLMVLLSRHYGNDAPQSLTLNKW